MGMPVARSFCTKWTRWRSSSVKRRWPLSARAARAGRRARSSASVCAVRPETSVASWIVSMHKRYDFERARSQAAVSLPRVTDRVPPFALVLAGVASVQFGAALARTMFDDLGPSGTSLLRVVFAALALMLLLRPDPQALRPGTRCATWSCSGVDAGPDEPDFYLGLDRLDLGVAVTIEFIGPLAVAVFGSRRRLDLVWAALAAIGIVLLANPGGAESIDTLGLIFVLIAGGVLGGVHPDRAARRPAVPGERRRGDGDGGRHVGPAHAGHRRRGQRSCSSRSGSCWAARSAC